MARDEQGSAPRASGTTAAAALAEGRWDDARAAFERDLSVAETPEATLGLATALWWLGESAACVERGSRAHALFRAAGDVPGAVQSAVWLAITYKSNFANHAAANGWLARAERLLEPLEPGPLHGWTWIARAYRTTDLDAAAELTGRALALAVESGDVDLELVALAQLGLVRVGLGEVDAGFGLLDEALAAALGGERSTLDTVVYACCDMLTACELASDLDRAVQWSRAADAFVDRYGCPFLYAECRISYGRVLTARGRWDEAERELDAGLRITAGACPGLHVRAVARLAQLRLEQGRWEEAELLLAGLGGDVEAEAEATLLTAALALARGDAPTAERLLEQRLRALEHHRWLLAGALELLVRACVADGRPDAADAAARRLDAVAAGSGSRHLAALATGARGHVLVARGDPGGVPGLEAALEAWSALGLPLEAGRTRLELAAALAAAEPDAAVEHARRAWSAFDGLGATADADRAAALLRSAGAAPPAAPRRAGVLTVREREVLRLVAAGLSNPEIAERLCVSRKTASHHVSSILTKLGLRNRAEAAAHAVAALDEPAAARAGRR